MTFAKLRAQVRAVYDEIDVISELNSLRGLDDKHNAHIDADDILLKFLDDKHPKVSEAYREVRASVGGFWYS